MVSYEGGRRLATVIRQFKGCHVEPAKNAMALWKYCHKEESRLPGGDQFSEGLPPAAKNVRGDTKEKNRMILEYGLSKALDEGLVSFEKAA